MSIKSAFTRRSGAFAVALLALSFSLGGSYVVRADDPVSTTFLQEIFVDPIVTAVNGLERRLTSLEETLALFANSFSSQRISSRELCVSDDSGAQTCVTKAQLDRLLLKIVAEAEVEQPAITLSDIDATLLSAESVEITATIEGIPSPPIAAPIEGMVDNQEIDNTGTATIADSGAAIVWSPEVENSTQATMPQEE